MTPRHVIGPLALALLAAVTTGWFATAPDMRVRYAPPPAAVDQLARGEWLVTAGTCGSCHTPRDRPDLFLAGGPRMNTPFGDFHVPNITPHATGLGLWSEQDFVRAMRNGVTPDGRHLYPVFPYRWYRGLSDADLAAMWAYLRSVPPVDRQTPSHDLAFPFSVRRAIGVWKLLNMRDSAGGTALDRGELLVDALGHCGACHTPSLMFAYYWTSKELAGDATPLGPYTASNITPAGLGDWSDDDLLRVLDIGMRPDGTPVRGDMAEYVADASSRLSNGDRRAIVAYLRGVAPIDDDITRSASADDEGGVFREHSLVVSVTAQPDMLGGRAVAFTGRTACALCHSPGPGVADQPLFPILRGQSASYLRARLRNYAENETHPVMTPIAQALTPRQMRNVADFYAAQTPPYNVAAAREDDGRALHSRGAVLARRGDTRLGVRACAACHGESGEGFPPSYPYIAGQPAAYIEAQFAAWREGRRDPGPLGVMGEIARRLPPQDARAVADYYGGLLRPVQIAEARQ